MSIPLLGGVFTRVPRHPIISTVEMSMKLANQHEWNGLDSLGTDGIRFGCAMKAIRVEQTIDETDTEIVVALTTAGPTCDIPMGIVVSVFPDVNDRSTTFRWSRSDKEYTWVYGGDIPPVVNVEVL